MLSEPVTAPRAKVILPAAGWNPVNWRELWAYRELLYFLTWRDVKVRYKQTALGVLWAFLQPFLKLVVFSVVFGRLAKMDSEGFPYPVFLYAGLLPWQFFQEALTRAGQSVIGNSTLVTKIYFPRLLIPFAAVAGALVDFAIAFLILFALMFHYGVAPGVSVLAVPVLAALTVLAATGLGTLFGALNVAYRDFRYVVPYVVQVGLFVTPVIYPVRIFPERWQWAVCLNPMAGLVDAWRSALLGKPFAWGNLGVSTAVTVALAVFALYYFRRLETRFADIV